MRLKLRLCGGPPAYLDGGCVVSKMNCGSSVGLQDCGRKAERSGVTEAKESVEERTSWPGRAVAPDERGAKWERVQMSRSHEQVRKWIVVLSPTAAILSCKGVGPLNGRADPAILFYLLSLSSLGKASSSCNSVYGVMFYFYVDN